MIIRMIYEKCCGRWVFCGNHCSLFRKGNKSQKRIFLKYWFFFLCFPWNQEGSQTQLDLWAAVENWKIYYLSIGCFNSFLSLLQPSLRILLIAKRQKFFSWLSGVNLIQLIFFPPKLLYDTAAYLFSCRKLGVYKRNSRVLHLGII